MITWVGQSPHWENPGTEGGLVMPLVEEAVLEVAFSPGRHVSRQAAVNCTSRLALRTALATTDLNPDWRPFAWVPGVIKSPASCMNLGVRCLPATEYTDRLRQHCPELANFGVIEERIEGRHIQQDGYVISGNVRLFKTLQQFWDGDRITRYERAHSAIVQSCAFAAVTALGLNDCPFCFEFIIDRTGRPYLIDAHARLGEDEGMSELLANNDPLNEIERFAILN